MGKTAEKSTEKTLQEPIALDSQHTVWLVKTFKGPDEETTLEKEVKLDYRPLENESVRVCGIVENFRDIIHNIDDGRMECLLHTTRTKTPEKLINHLKKQGWIVQGENQESEPEE